MENEILNLAHEAIKTKLLKDKVLDKPDFIQNIPEFSNNTATFVTLKIKGQLRGCIGSLVAHRSLYDDLVSNSIAAAFEDPRFSPLSKEEFDTLDIEVSLLSEPHLINYEDLEDLESQVEIGEDGIVLKFQHYQSTFLPQVWEELKDFESFFSHLCLKAGLDISIMKSHPLIYKYQVKKIKK